MMKKSRHRLRVRVTAKRRGGREFNPFDSYRKLRNSEICNTVKKLHWREIGGSRKACRGAPAYAREKFRNFRLESRQSPMPPISGILSETFAMAVCYAYSIPPSVPSQTSHTSSPSLSPLPAASGLYSTTSRTPTPYTTLPNILCSSKFATDSPLLGIEPSPTSSIPVTTDDDSLVSHSHDDRLIAIRKEKRNAGKLDRYSDTAVLSIEEFDTYDPTAHIFLRLQFLKNRSKIIEIVAAKDIIFALAHSGLCAAFSRTTNKRICIMNIIPDEVIRSLFYNKNNESLITVSVYASDNFSSLKCRTTPIEYIRRNHLDAGFPLFESESLKWPGFVEFDDVNGKILTYSAQDGVYKVYDLKNYIYLYSISDKNIQEIKISPGIMLLIFQRTPGYVPLTILSIEDGSVLKSFSHLLHRNKKVDFIEQFNEKLLVKQENENLQIRDVRNSEIIEVSRNDFMTPSAFIFLYENNLFLTFRESTVAVWNFRGELVTSFEDHLLCHPDCNTNMIYITSDQDLIISYCKSEQGTQHIGECKILHLQILFISQFLLFSAVLILATVSTAGSINMSNILTGKCIAKICSSEHKLQITSKRRARERSWIRSSAQEALEDVTALFYDEDRNEIYTGNNQGLIHVWSN
ncbi:hypothetical protein GIB67_009001 [Kingdonia uniflora]|uniref:Transducin/WD40 repeat-like superfamily protein n=1 Tax=Kingdonia uniflora TaxID=39325 RepID=A0A7J7LVR9_9MAGN|nr:hypothetical protein GIB67_009001 [Kingdonia uniflora]